MQQRLDIASEFGLPEPQAKQSRLLLRKLSYGLVTLRFYNLFAFVFQNYCQFALCQGPPPVSQSPVSVPLSTSFTLRDLLRQQCSAMSGAHSSISFWEICKFAEMSGMSPAFVPWHCRWITFNATDWPGQ